MLVPHLCGRKQTKMTDDAGFPFDTSGMTEILFDDIRNLSVYNGIFRCTLYSYRIVAGFAEPCWVPVTPLAMPVAAVGPVAQKAMQFVGAKSVQTCAEFVRDRMHSLLH